MVDGNFVTYFRVSKKQGQELDQQKAAVERFLNGGNHQIVGSYEEKETGKKAGLKNRPQLRAAIAEAKSKNAVLLIAKIDRLARNVHFISGLMESKVKFVACDLPEANDLTIHIMAAMAEQEAKAISTRTKDRLAYLRSQGKRSGNPNNGTTVQTAKAAQGRVDAADEFIREIMPTIQNLWKKGISTNKHLAEMLNFGNVKTRQGKEWDEPKISRLLSRAKAIGAL